MHDRRQPPPPARPLPHRPQPRARKRTSWRPWLLMGGALTFGSVLALAAIAFVALLLMATPDRVAAGVTVAGQDIGGSSQREAESLIANLAARPIALVDGVRQWQVTPGEFGIRVDVDGTLADALDAAPGSPVALRVALDLSQTQTMLVNLSPEINIPPETEPEARDGWVMEIPVMLDRLWRDAPGELADAAVELSMMAVEPPRPVASNGYSGEPVTHVVEAGQELGLIAKQYNVSISDIVQMNDLTDPDLLFIGQELLIPAAGIYAPTEETAPPAPSATGRSILVSTGDQRIYAYENGKLVHSHLVSTGRSETPTVLGDYQIYVKYAADDMSGPGYFLPQVPYTMYFYQGYAIHGTYWHNAFGRPMSHGCVNLPVDEAQWFFDFAEVGTLVRVI